MRRKRLFFTWTEKSGDKIKIENCHSFGGGPFSTLNISINSLDCKLCGCIKISYPLEESVVFLSCVSDSRVFMVDQRQSLASQRGCVQCDIF